MEETVKDPVESSATEEANAGSGSVDTATEKTGERQRSDYIPRDRFDEVLADRNELKERLAKLEGKLESRQEAVTEEKLPFTDITSLSKEQLMEWAEEDPIGFERNKARQLAWELDKRYEQKEKALLEKIEKQNTQKQKEKVMTDWVDKNPEFKKLYNSGDLQDYIRKNPIHEGNLIGAYYALQADKAVNASAQNTQAHKAAKSSLKTLGSAPATSYKPSDDPRLKNTRKHGGPAKVIADRLREMRSSG